MTPSLITTSGVAVGVALVLPILVGLPTFLLSTHTHARATLSSSPVLSRERQRQVRKWQQQQRGRQNNYRHVQLKQRESSVTVRPDWVVIEEMEKSQLGKLSLPTVGDPEDLVRRFPVASDRISRPCTCGAHCFFFAKK